MATNVETQADIRFEAGFNALTGETGAGKSIVIDALSAVLGQRTSRELIRTGADKAFVSAVFSGVDSAIAEEQGVTPEEDGSLLLQRRQPAWLARLRAVPRRLVCDQRPLIRRDRERDALRRHIRRPERPREQRRIVRLVRQR